jgi:hypothetical protein
MTPRDRNRSQCFFGTLEECVEKFGGKARFIVSAPVTFFSGARLETHRRAQSNDGLVTIVERQLMPTVCEVYLQAAAMRPQSAHPANLPQSNCA